MDRRRAAAALLALAACIACTAAAPTANNQTALELLDGTTDGCYYNFQHYGEGDRIMTNEPCLNCTCHNRMLMCYLRVCPFTKPIGQDCTVEKRADQCCPIVTCPDVPVDLLTSTSTSSPAEYGSTGVGKYDRYGCSINGKYFSEGSKVPSMPNKPCEHCYCIRNMTTCVMQECTLHVDGCTPIYHKDVCCPVRYSCDHEDEIPLLDDMTTTERPTPGYILTTTTVLPVTQMTQDCMHDDQIFPDGALIETEKACEHCYCMKGDIVCVVQECGTPMENEGKNCTSLPPRHGQCCPDTYICEGDDHGNDLTTEIIDPSTPPPRRTGVEGSGYRNEPDEPFTEIIPFETDTEGSGEDYATAATIGTIEDVITEKVSPDMIDEMLLATTDSQFGQTTEPDKGQNTIPDLISDKTSTELSKEEKVPISTESNVEFATTLAEVKTTTDKYKNIDEEVFITTEPTSRKDDNNMVSDEIITLKDKLSTTSTDLIDETTQKDDRFVDEHTRKDDHLVVETTTSEDRLVDESTNRNLETEHHITTQKIEYASENEDDMKQKEITTENYLPLSTTDKNISEEITKTSVDISKTTVTEKLDIAESTSVNPVTNEVDQSISYPGRIPGEGDCLLNGITYSNNTLVPSTNNCHTSCKCISSIIKCDPIICSPPPEYMENMNDCQPIYDSPEACCPTYVCSGKETIPPQSHSQMSGTESPKPIVENECNSKECVLNTEEKPISDPSTSCKSGECMTELDKKQEQSYIPPVGQDCLGDKCQISPVVACEGDNCEAKPIELESHKKPDSEVIPPITCDGIDGCEKPKDIEEECHDQKCRRKESSELDKSKTKIPEKHISTINEHTTEIFTSDATKEATEVFTESSETSTVSQILKEQSEHVELPATQKVPNKSEDSLVTEKTETELTDVMDDMKLTEQIGDESDSLPTKLPELQGSKDVIFDTTQTERVTTEKESFHDDSSKSSENDQAEIVTEKVQIYDESIPETTDSDITNIGLSDDKSDKSTTYNFESKPTDKTVATKEITEIYGMTEKPTTPSILLDAVTKRTETDKNKDTETYGISSVTNGEDEVNKEVTPEIQTQSYDVYTESSENLSTKEEKFHETAKVTTEHSMQSTDSLTTTQMKLENAINEKEITSTETSDQKHTSIQTAIDEKSEEFGKPVTVSQEILEATDQPQTSIQTEVDEKSEEFGKPVTVSQEIHGETDQPQTSIQTEIDEKSEEFGKPVTVSQEILEATDQPQTSIQTEIDEKSEEFGKPVTVSQEIHGETDQPHTSIQTEIDETSEEFGKPVTASQEIHVPTDQPHTSVQTEINEKSEEIGKPVTVSQEIHGTSDQPQTSMQTEFDEKSEEFGKPVTVSQEIHGATEQPQTSMQTIVDEKSEEFGKPVTVSPEILGETDQPLTSIQTEIDEKSEEFGKPVTVSQEIHGATDQPQTSMEKEFDETSEEFGKPVTESQEIHGETDQPHTSIQTEIDEKSEEIGKPVTVSQEIHGATEQPQTSMQTEIGEKSEEFGKPVTISQEIHGETDQPHTSIQTEIDEKSEDFGKPVTVSQEIHGASDQPQTSMQTEFDEKSEEFGKPVTVSQEIHGATEQPQTSMQTNIDEKSEEFGKPVTLSQEIHAETSTIMATKLDEPVTKAIIENQFDSTVRDKELTKLLESSSTEKQESYTDIPKIYTTLFGELFTKHYDMNQESSSNLPEFHTTIDPDIITTKKVIEKHEEDVLDKELLTTEKLSDSDEILYTTSESITSTVKTIEQSTDKVNAIAIESTPSEIPIEKLDDTQITSMKPIVAVEQGFDNLMTTTADTILKQERTTVSQEYIDTDSQTQTSLLVDDKTYISSSEAPTKLPSQTDKQDIDIATEQLQETDKTLTTTTTQSSTLNEDTTNQHITEPEKKETIFDVTSSHIDLTTKSSIFDQVNVEISTTSKTQDESEIASSKTTTSPQKLDEEEKEPSSPFAEIEIPSTISTISLKEKETEILSYTTEKINFVEENINKQTTDIASNDQVFKTTEKSFLEEEHLPLSTQENKPDEVTTHRVILDTEHEISTEKVKLPNTFEIDGPKDIFTTESSLSESDTTDTIIDKAEKITSTPDGFVITTESGASYDAQTDESIVTTLQTLSEIEDKKKVMTTTTSIQSEEETTVTETPTSLVSDNTPITIQDTSKSKIEESNLESTTKHSYDRITKLDDDHIMVSDQYTTQSHLQNTESSTDRLGQKNEKIMTTENPEYTTILYTDEKTLPSVDKKVSDQQEIITDEQINQSDKVNDTKTTSPSYDMQDTEGTTIIATKEETLGTDDQKTIPEKITPQLPEYQTTLTIDEMQTELPVKEIITIPPTISEPENDGIKVTETIPEIEAERTTLQSELHYSEIVTDITDQNEVPDVSRTQTHSITTESIKSSITERNEADTVAYPSLETIRTDKPTEMVTELKEHKDTDISEINESTSTESVKLISEGQEFEKTDFTKEYPETTEPQYVTLTEHKDSSTETVTLNTKVFDENETDALHLVTHAEHIDESTTVKGSSSTNISDYPATTISVIENQTQSEDKDGIPITEATNVYSQSPKLTTTDKKNEYLPEVYSTQSSIEKETSGPVTQKELQENIITDKIATYVPEILDSSLSTEKHDDSNLINENYSTTSSGYKYSETTPLLVELTEHTHHLTDDLTTRAPLEYITTVISESQQPERGDQILDDFGTNKNEYQFNESPKTTVQTHIDENIQTTITPLKTESEILVTTEKTIVPTTTYNKLDELEKDASTLHDTGEASSTLPQIIKEYTTELIEIQHSTFAPTLAAEEISTKKEFTSEKPLTSEISDEKVISEVTKGTTSKSAEESSTYLPPHTDKTSKPEEKPSDTLPNSTQLPDIHKPGFTSEPNEVISSPDMPPSGSGGYGQEPDEYIDEDQAFGPGTCRYGGKVYVSAQQIPRDDPCDFCFCFRSDIICLQQSCPPPIHGCHEEPIQGFCCPRYECPVSMATTLNVTTTTTTTTTTLPPHFLPHAYKGAAQRKGCQIKGHSYKVGEVVRASSGPCLHCTCGGDGQMKCDPKACTPEPMLRQMIAAAVSSKRRR